MKHLKTSVALAVIASMFASSAFAESPVVKAPVAKSTAEVGLVGGKDPVSVTVADAKFSLRAFKTLQPGAICNLIPGDKVTKIDVAADGTVIFRKTKSSISKAAFNGTVCPSKFAGRTTAPVWASLVANEVAAAAQQVVKTGKKS